MSRSTGAPVPPLRLPGRFGPRRLHGRQVE